MVTDTTRYTGFGLRLIAATIDSLISFLIFFLIDFLLMFTDLSLISFGLIAWFIGFAIFSVYEIYLTYKYGGTVGKLLMRCTVSDVNGNALTLGSSTSRYFSKILSLILLGIGYLMILWDHKKQGLHDKIAKTYVVSDENSKVTNSIRTALIILASLFIAGYIVYAGSIVALGASVGFKSTLNELSLSDISTECDSKVFWLRDRCYTEYVGETSSFHEANKAELLDYCSKISRDSEYVECISYVAMIEGDKTICDLVRFSYDVRMCYKIYDFGDPFLSEIRDERDDAELIEKLSEVVDELYDNFDNMFVSFQKIDNYNSKIYDSYLDTPTLVQTATKQSDLVSAELSNIEQYITGINDTVHYLLTQELTEESLNYLGELEQVYLQYNAAALNLKLASEGTERFLLFRQYEAEIFLLLDEYNAKYDVAFDYMDGGDYSAALVEFDKAVDLNDQMMVLREEQLDLNGDINMNLIKRKWEDDSRYIVYITKMREGFALLDSNPDADTDPINAELDSLYAAYANSLVKDVDYENSIQEWLQENVDQYTDLADEIIIETDIRYNSLMDEFELYIE